MKFVGGIPKKFYTKEPRKAFKKIKEAYDNDRIKKEPYTIKPVEESTLIKVRQRIEDQVRKSQIKATIILSLSTLIGILLSFFWSDLIIWWFRL